MRPAGPAPKVQIVPVWRLLRYVKTRLREDPKLQYLGVSGEVSNLKRQPNGTLYFDLKDADGLLNCVAWAEAALALPPVENGDAIVALGAVTVYEKQSRVQLDVRAVQSRNRPGDLHRKYEELRRKLQAEGLFAQDRKRRLPRFPFRIALVSSRGAQGAGDFQTIVANRAPHVEVVVCETAVQGFGANLEIARAIDKASKLDVDCIVVARGGGSFEDLFPFSQEEVVRAIVRASKPVVAAIGHEGDTPLADLVADERAPTPSAAAHRLVPERAALLAQLAGMRVRAAQAALRVVARAESDAQKAVRYSALADPMRFSASGGVRSSACAAKPSSWCGAPSTPGRSACGGSNAGWRASIRAPSSPSARSAWSSCAIAWAKAPGPAPSARNSARRAPANGWRGRSRRRSNGPRPASRSRAHAWTVRIRKQFCNADMRSYVTRDGWCAMPPRSPRGRGSMRRSLAEPSSRASKRCNRMAETKAGEFERSLDRLEAIVKQLEGDGVGLDESVALFREGKQLAKRCEVLLGAARAAIETADGEEPAGKGTPSLFAGGGDTLSDEIEF